MLEFLKNKRNLFIAASLIIIFAAAVFIWQKKSSPEHQAGQGGEKFAGIVINDEVKIPDTKSILSSEGEIIPRGEYEIKLNPASSAEEVLITKAKLTLKGAYEASIQNASAWSGDAKLILIRSNGALGLDGKSSSWQIIFGSEEKKEGYEIIIEADKIISECAIDSDSYGYDLPLNWYDSNDAIASFNSFPQFATSTMSAISFFYSPAAESWSYGVANGEQTTSMWVK